MNEGGFILPLRKLGDPTCGESGGFDREDRVLLSTSTSTQKPGRSRCYPHEEEEKSVQNYGGATAKPGSNTLKTFKTLDC